MSENSAAKALVIGRTFGTFAWFESTHWVEPGAERVFGAIKDDAARRTDQMGETGTLATLVLGVLVSHGCSLQGLASAFIVLGG